MSKIFEATQRAKSAGSTPGRVVEMAGPPVEPRQAAGMFSAERPEDDADDVVAPLPTVPRPHVPVMPAPRVSADPTLAARLITAGESAAAFTEYRRLAATLHQAQVEHRIRTVLVTSSMPGEGKSLSAANLALTLADVYRRRVLLVDADTRRPMLHQLFGISNEVGLLECVRQGRVLPSSIVEVSMGLHLLAGGKPVSDPVNELSSSRLRDFFTQVARDYDWVVVDTPPAILLPDTELIAPLVDACLLVIQAGRTPYKKVKKLVETIGRERILGVILNRAEAVDVPGSEYGDYYYSAYHSRTGTH
jgi:capsular exopolysaccharide synthesis family protein